MKILIMLLLIPLLSWSETDFQGLEWLEKYRDANGCIPVERLVEPETKVKVCPPEFSPQIRPKLVGTLRRHDGKKELCCYDWKRYGNR